MHDLHDLLTTSTINHPILIDQTAKNLKEKMVKIIKENPPHYQVTCGVCRSTLEYHVKECKITATGCGDALYEIKCPVCHFTICSDLGFPGKLIYDKTTNS